MAAFDAFAIADTASDTAVSHTTEADRGLAGSPVFEQGDWADQWSTPALTIPNTAHILAGYSDYVRYAGTTRSNSFCKFRINTTNQGINGLCNGGGARSANADVSRNGVFIGALTADDDLIIREGCLHGGSVRTGDYDRTTGDPRGLWALELPAADFIYTSLSSNQTAAARYSEIFPTNLGTPSALTEGTIPLIVNLTTDSSSGTTVTRSGGVFTVAANSMVLCVATFQSLNQDSSRANFMIRMDVDDVPYCWVSEFSNGSSAWRNQATSIVIPVITNGSTSTVKFYFIENAFPTTPAIDLDDAFIGFYDFTGQDICILDKTDADVVDIIPTHQTISWPVADEIQVDSDSFEHPTGALTQIKNNAGETITVLAGYYIIVDRAAAGSTRKFCHTQISKNDTPIDYMISGSYNRGNSTDPTQSTGPSFCGVIEMTTGQYLDLDSWDSKSSSTSDSLINFTDGGAGKFWAIRLEAAAPAANVETPGVVAAMTHRRSISRMRVS